MKTTITISFNRIRNIVTDSTDRFGNPKVIIGLPDRQGLKTCSQSSFTNLDSTFITKSTENLNESAKREHVARREQNRLKQLSDQSKKEELRGEYHRNYKNQVIEFEKRRNEAANLKIVDKNIGKQEIKSQILNRLDSNKMDIEAKEQAKYAFLRNQANKRNLENLNKQIDYEAKETNKIAFKKQEQEKRNQIYHDRLVVEEAFRKAQQKQVQDSHNKQRVKEQTRENLSRKITEIEKSLKQNSLLKTQGNFLFGTK